MLRPECSVACGATLFPRRFDYCITMLIKFTKTQCSPSQVLADKYELLILIVDVERVEGNPYRHFASSVNPKPKYAIILKLSMDHFQYYTYEDRAVFKREELPSLVKALFPQACLDALVDF